MTTIYAATDAQSETAALLDLIWRKAPVLMRAGGGALEQETRAPFVTADEKELVAELFREGKSLDDIADHTGRSYGTIVKLTRHLRHGR